MDRYAEDAQRRRVIYYLSLALALTVTMSLAIDAQMLLNRSKSMPYCCRFVSETMCADALLPKLTRSDCYFARDTLYPIAIGACILFSFFFPLMMMLSWRWPAADVRRFLPDDSGCMKFFRVIYWSVQATVVLFIIYFSFYQVDLAITRVLYAPFFLVPYIFLYGIHTGFSTYIHSYTRYTNRIEHFPIVGSPNQPNHTHAQGLGVSPIIGERAGSMSVSGRNSAQSIVGRGGASNYGASQQANSGQGQGRQNKPYSVDPNNSKSASQSSSMTAVAIVATAPESRTRTGSVVHMLTTASSSNLNGLSSHAYIPPSQDLVASTSFSNNHNSNNNNHNSQTSKSNALTSSSSSSLAKSSAPRTSSSSTFLPSVQDGHEEDDEDSAGLVNKHLLVNQVYTSESLIQEGVSDLHLHRSKVSEAEDSIQDTSIMF